MLGFSYKKNEVQHTIIYVENRWKILQKRYSVPKYKLYFGTLYLPIGFLPVFYIYSGALHLIFYKKTLSILIFLFVFFGRNACFYFKKSAKIAMVLLREPVSNFADLHVGLFQKDFCL